VLLITPERARGIFKRLKKGEYDVEGGLASGQLTLFDARETLGKFMVADMPDWGRFKAVVGSVLERSVARGCGMRVRAPWARWSTCSGARETRRPPSDSRRCGTIWAGATPSRSSART
jgi:hypothetical protein